MARFEDGRGVFRNTEASDVLRGSDRLAEFAHLFGGTWHRAAGELTLSARATFEPDPLVLVREPLGEALEQELLDATYPLFLESGRQLGPQFRTPEQHADSAARAIDADSVEPTLP